MNGRSRAGLTALFVALCFMMLPPNRVASRGVVIDPDLPPWVQDTFDKSAYLARRAEHTAVLRGLPDAQPDSRVRALRALEQQEQDERSRRPGISDTTWTQLGPAPVPLGQTEGTRTNVSGRTISIAIHPTNPDIVYAGTANGGIYRSLNGGTIWTAIFDNALSLSVGALALANDGTTLYAGTGEHRTGFFGVGLYRIDNAGTTADLVGPINPNGIFSGNAISEVLVHPTDPNTVFVATGIGSSGVNSVVGGNGAAAARAAWGVFRSTNGKSAANTVAFDKLTLIGVPNNDRPIFDLVLDSNAPSVLVASVMGLTGDVGVGGIYRSTNALVASAAAVAFQKVFDSPTQSARIELAAGRAPGDETPTTFLAAVQTADGGQIKKSSNGGATFPTTLLSATGFCGGQCFYDIGIAAVPNNPNTIFVGGQATNTDPNRGPLSVILSRTTDGTNFVNKSNGLHADLHAIAIAPSNPSVVYVGNDGGIFKSINNGDTWISLNNDGFHAQQFVSIATHPTDRNLMIGGTQDNGTQMMKPDGSFFHSQDGDGGFTLIDQNATDTTNVTMYHTFFNIVGNDGLVGFGRTTTLAGAIPFPNGWTDQLLGCGGTPNGLSCNDSATLFYSPMALGPGNPNTLYFGTDRLYRSANRGSTMTVVSQGPFATGVAVSAIGISPQDDAVRLVGLENGRAFFTTTGGATQASMTEITASFPAKFVSRAVVDPNNKNVAYLTFTGFGVPSGQHVWKTTNLPGGAAAWAPSGTNIPDVPVQALVIDPTNSNNVYVGTDIGVFRSTDAGATWQPYSNGLPRVPVFDMAFQAKGSNTVDGQVLRIATHGRGFWEIKTGGGGGGGGGQANLTVQKQAPTQVTVNTNLTYTITVKNTGGATASGVRLSDPLPGGLTPFQPPTSTIGTCSNAATVTCTVGDLAPNTTATITILVRPTQAGDLTNIVTANPGNKQAQATTSVAGGGGGGGSIRLVMAAPLGGGNTMVYCYTFQGPGLTGWYLLDTDGTFAYTSLNSSFKAKKGLVTAKDNAGIFLDFGVTQGSVKSKMSAKLAIGGLGSMSVSDKIFGKSYMTNFPVQTFVNALPCVVPALEGATPAELLQHLGPVNLDAGEAPDGTRASAGRAEGPSRRRS